MEVSGDRMAADVRSQMDRGPGGWMDDEDANDGWPQGQPTSVSHGGPDTKDKGVLLPNHHFSSAALLLRKHHEDMSALISHESRDELRLQCKDE